MAARFLIQGPGAKAAAKGLAATSGLGLSIEPIRRDTTDRRPHYLHVHLLRHRRGLPDSVAVLEQVVSNAKILGSGNAGYIWNGGREAG